MKKLLLTLALISPLANATVNLPPCDELGQLSAEIMVERQHGALMSNVMRKYSTHETPTFAKVLIIMAFDRRAYSSNEYKVRSVVNFRNYVEVACYKYKEKNKG